MDGRRALAVGDWVRHTSRKGRKTFGRILALPGVGRGLFRVRWTDGEEFIDLDAWSWELRRARPSDWEIAGWMTVELSK